MSSEQDFTCVFCKESFENKETLQEHFRKHGDPKFNQGKNKSRFQIDQSVEKTSEENEVVGCDVCDETFPSISKAITHKHKVHPDHDAKYFCPWCGKLFTMKHLYNKHMQTNHNDLMETGECTHHCDCCNVDFFVASAMVYHNKFFHRQDSELPAIGQSKKVKFYNQEVLQIYYCPFCGEEYNNKVNLHKHMGDDHSDENQGPDEVLRCPICDAIFYHLDAYELHLSFHSSEDVYSDENIMSQDITEFSLECVPPVMEKVEEEIKSGNDEGIDKFLQLIMDESLESGNTDPSEKPRTKKHKKHKKSKKSAITLDEFLNMNKDVFGDGLDVQGIEEVPTQQVLKKCKGKKEGRVNTTKPISASAIAKLKKQGITIKSKGGLSSTILQGNRDLTINTLNHRVPIKVQEKPPSAAASDELLSKLLNQGSSQIKIVKKAGVETVSNQLSPLPNSTKLINNDDLSMHLNEEGTVNKISDVLIFTDNKLPSNKDKLDTEDSEIEHDINISTTDIEEDKAKTDNNFQSLKDYNHTKLSDDHYNNLDYQNEYMSKSQNILKKNSQHKSDLSDPEDNTDFNENTSNINESDDDSSHIQSSDLICEKNKNVSEESNQNEQEKIAVQNANHKSLDALKHLSHLITVKQVQNVENINSESDQERIISEENNSDIIDKIPSNIAMVGNDLQDVTFKKPLPVNKQDICTKTTEALKNIGKNVIIKPCSSSISIIKSSDNSDNNDDDDDNNDDNDDEYSDLNIQNNDVTNINSLMSQTIHQNNIKCVANKTIHSKDVKKTMLLKNITKESWEDGEQTRKPFNIDILKRLTNVTAKPVGVTKTTNEQIIKKSPNSVVSKQLFPKVDKSKQIDEDIEIFNIDDSDDDDPEKDDEITKSQLVNSPKSNETKSTVSADMLKNLSKNITIKSTSQSKQLTLSSIKKEPEGSRPNLTNKIKGTSNDSLVKFQTSKQLNTNISHTLKKLGNNISIKSQLSSQKYQNEIDVHADDNYQHQHDEESDSEINNVKITEVQEDQDSIASDTDMEYNGNVIVQSPHESESENEDQVHNSNSDDDGIEDTESQIKMKLTQTENSSNRSVDAFKKNNKELTIKTLNDRNTGHCQESSPNPKGIPDIAKNISKDVSIKQFRESADKQESNESFNKNVNVIGSLNQKTATSNKVNKVNTVKTVKTFQSETIIEEITTTVTKTIRTVNQSSKQVAQNAATSNYKSINRPRMTLPMNHQSKLVQGMTVRNAKTVGTKIRNTAPILRPTIALPVKQVGQLVPVRNQLIPRQGINPFRPSAPGSSNIRKPSQPNTQKPVIGKPLKISPLAMNQTIKRPSEEGVGHFSCFKRSKDSMLDGLEDEIGDEGSISFSSACSSRSDFSSTATKIIKGKSIVTASQSRSEQHSEQHVSKLNNMSGLKVVRTSAKQAAQVECRSEVGTAKRNTMEALEKLQKQGLLIKKPRVDVPGDNKQFNSDSDDDDSGDK